MTECSHKSRQGRSGVLDVLRWRGVRLGVLACVLVVAAGVRPAQALHINVSYDPVDSDPPTGDWFGIRLTDIVDAAANHWEDIITDPVTINVTIRWKGGFADPDVLATAWLTGQGAGGRPSAGKIHFNKTFPFYYDSTPENDDEYDMQQRLYRGLDPGQQSSWFNGSPPPVLETSYGGAVTGSAPLEAQNGTDLFTLALHELGHILGMNDYTAALQVLDGDYDFNPAFIGGATAAVVNDDAHLLTPGALMFSGLSEGRRFRPSATDIFAIASTPVLPWSGIELSRRNFLGGINLNADAAWTGGKKPGLTDDAYVQVNSGFPPLVATTGNMVFGTLNVLEGSWVTTNHVLNVTEATTIDGSDASPGDTSRIRVQSSGSLDTGDLVIGPNALLHLFDGYVRVDGDAQVAADGCIQGEGMMFVQGRMTNDGLIRADGYELMLSTWSSGAIWDLDGAGDGVLEVIDGDMFIYGAHIGSFHGTATIGAGRELDLRHPWWFGDNGTLTLDGGSAGPATLFSTDSRLRGSVVVDGTGIVDGRTTFQAPVQVSIPDAADRLELHDDVTFDGGDYTGDGTLKQMGDVDVNSDTSIDVAAYDWGNSSIFQVNLTVVSAGATFAVNSPTTGTSGNPYHGTLLVSGGVLVVNTDSFWTLPAPTGSPWFRSGGTLDLVESGGLPARVQGQALMLKHKIDAITGRCIIEADLVTTATAEIQVRNGADLQLAGHTKLNGGNIHGQGTLSQRGDITVTGDTAIDTAVFDWGNSFDTTIHTLAIQPGARLNVNSPTTGDGANVFRGAIDVDSGTLAVNTLDPWTLAAAEGDRLPQGVLTLSRTGPEKPSVTGIASMVVAGALNIDADEAFFESTMLLQGGKVTFLADGEMQHVAPVQFQAGTFDHAQKAGWFRTSPSARLAWAGDANITVAGSTGGSLTFDLASGTSVSVAVITPTLTIAPGATVNLAGATDPFTDSLDPTRHVNVVNNSTTSFNVVAGAKAVGTLSGGGNTFVAPGASLAAEAVVQNRVSIAAGGTLEISLAGSSILVGDALENAGLMRFSGDINVMGDVLNGGEIVVSGASTACFFNAVAQDGNLFVPAASTANFLGPVSGKGRFIGAGTVEFLGGVAPGKSIGVLSFDGDVVFGGSAVLEMELGGTTGSGDYNHDQITGAATIMLVGGPTLEILPWNSFVPKIGDEFVIMTWQTGLGGVFGTTVVDSWFTGHGIDFDLHYNNTAGAGDLTIEAVPEPATLALLALGAWLPLRRRRR